ncbi:MAG TPA: pitrilysin family protein [Bryobacterales bacterium]|jgi:zinc protease|nr:pitrilysin family protein [Bryobacterales bacterium]
MISRLPLSLFLLFSAALMQAQKIDRTKPPDTPPLPVYKLPPVFETRLPNGLLLVLVQDNRFPLVTVRLDFQAGSKFDPADLPGLSENVGALLKEGTTTRSSRQIAEELASIGGSLNVSSSRDTLIIGANALSENTSRLLDLVADVARNATFPSDEVELRKQNRKQSLLLQRSRADFQGELKFNEIVYGPHPYSRISPTPESIDKIDAAKLTAFRDQFLVPNNAVLIVLGQLPQRDKVMDLVRQKFGEWRQKPLPAPPKAEFPESRRTLVLVDRPGSVQADIRVGRLAVTRTSPEYFPMVLANAILGTGTSSRLFNDIREKRGYAYDAHSVLDAQKDAGVFEAVTQVRNEVIEPAVEAMLSNLEVMSKTPVGDSELRDFKNFLSGFFVMRLESQNGLATQLALVKSMGLPNDYLETYTTRIRSVEPDQILSAAKKYISPEQAAIVVVGDAQKIAPALEKIGKFEVTKVQ